MTCSRTVSSKWARRVGVESSADYVLHRVARCRSGSTLEQLLQVSLSMLEHRERHTEFQVFLRTPHQLRYARREVFREDEIFTSKRVLPNEEAQHFYQMNVQVDLLY